MKKQIYNPYMPGWEYVPDGEPHVFGDRVYVYGSHDIYNGWVYCLGDYVCWSAPVNDLTDWRYEGVIFPRSAPGRNEDRTKCLYAPDVTQGPDGRYYLYYVYDREWFVSVAVSDTPAGKYEFLGYVHYKDGTRYGENHAKGDEPQFDPGVLTEGDKTYLYTGFCMPQDTSRHGPMCVVLGKDMLTIEEDITFVAPSKHLAQGSGYEGHEFFEASSMRKVNGKYYFIYSSINGHELCYATGDSPKGPFKYRGVIISNCDKGISSYKDANRPTAYGANNHGSIEFINGEWYIFYHRHTNGTEFSRQACAEKIKILEDGTIPQVELTSCGLNGGPLEGKGEYPAVIACNLFTDRENGHVTNDDAFPNFKQYSGEPDEDFSKADPKDIPETYIYNMKDSATAGYKYFDFKDTKKVSVITRGYCNGKFEVRTTIDGPVLAEIPVEGCAVWQKWSCDVDLNCGKSALYLTFKGTGFATVKSIVLE